ncbi:MAG: PAM68 family protein [Cyanobacteria bacterium J06607_13]
MTSTSDKKSSGGESPGQSTQFERAALPFEPKRSRKREKDTDGSAAGRQKTERKAKQKTSKKADRKAAKEKDGADAAVSAKAQARVEAIRAANRQRAAAKAAEKDGEAIAGPDSDGSIPKEVSRRMVRRMAVLSIAPIAVGVSIFFVSYYLLSHEIVTFAPIVTLLTTMGCFGLGVVGLTYGMLSASWDEEPGSLVGFDEFKLNFGRIMDARRASKT